MSVITREEETMHMDSWKSNCIVCGREHNSSSYSTSYCSFECSEKGLTTKEEEK